MTHWIRFEHAGQPGFGTLDGTTIHLHTGDMFAAPTPTGTTLDLAATPLLAPTLLAPVLLAPVLLAPVRPAKFIGLWNNFHAVATAQNLAIPDFPLFFLKATSSILAPEASFRAPTGYTGRIVYEGELGIVIGTRCKDVSEAEAETNIFGYTCVNDITAVELFGTNEKFEQWARAKSCDGFGPVGPTIATDLDWRAARVRTLLNGRERQNYPIADMILPPPRIVSLLSREITLEPGDLITCGTSSGILPMRPGATVEIVIDGIGTLRNTYGT